MIVRARGLFWRWLTGHELTEPSEFLRIGIKTRTLCLEHHPISAGFTAEGRACACRLACLEF